MKLVTRKEGGEKIANYTRLGKLAPDKKRPLLMSFKAREEKGKFMENLKNLKETQFNSINITHGLTPSQCQQLNKIREEAKQKEDAESGDWV